MTLTIQLRQYKREKKSFRRPFLLLYFAWSREAVQAGPERPEPPGAARVPARARSSRAGQDIAVSRSAVPLSAAETFDPSPPLPCKSVKERIYPLRWESERGREKKSNSTSLCCCTLLPGTVPKPKHHFSLHKKVGQRVQSELTTVFYISQGPVYCWNHFYGSWWTHGNFLAK